MGKKITPTAVVLKCEELLNSTKVQSIRNSPDDLRKYIKLRKEERNNCVVEHKKILSNYIQIQM